MGKWVSAVMAMLVLAGGVSAQMVLLDNFRQRVIDDEGTVGYTNQNALAIRGIKNAGSWYAYASAGGTRVVDGNETPITWLFVDNGFGGYFLSSEETMPWVLGTDKMVASIDASDAQAGSFYYGAIETAFLVDENQNLPVNPLSNNLPVNLSNLESVRIKGRTRGPLRIVIESSAVTNDANWGWSIQSDDWRDLDEEFLVSNMTVPDWAHLIPGGAGRVVALSQATVFSFQLNVMLSSTFGNSLDIEIEHIYLVFSGGIPAEFESSWDAKDITISTEAQLREFAFFANNFGMIFNEQTITLANDIDLENGDWTAINSFGGTFDGNGKVIRGLTGNQGLFRNNSGTIKNLGLVDIDIVGSSGHSVGGLVMQNTGGTIENCYVAGTIVVTGIGLSDEYGVGGLVGYNVSSMEIGGIIEGSYTNVTISGTNYVGGLVGRNGGPINNSYAWGNVTGTDYVGGLVGSNSARIRNSYAVGNVKGEFYTGSFAGSNSDMISNCYAFGTVTSDGDGAFVEHNTGTINAASGHRSPNDMTSPANYNNWNFDDIWGLNANINNGFPYLLALGGSTPTSITKNNFATAKSTNVASFAGIRNGQINLNLSVGNYTAELYNLQGRMIDRVNINAINGINAIGLKTDNLGRGVFILNVKHNGVSVLRQRIGVSK